MLRTLSQRLLTQSLFALLVALSIAAPAQAQVWYGSWDPPFGTPFTSGDPLGYNLGWGGGQAGTFVNVKVNAPCGPLPVGLKQNFADCGNSAVVQLAAVRLYDADVGQTPLFTLNFNPASLPIDYLDFGVDSRIKAINTTWVPNWETDLGAGTGADFALQFIINPTDCPACAPIYLDGFFPDLGLYTGPVLFARLPIDEGDICDSEGLPYVCVGDYKIYRANVLKFAPVVMWTPEPAGLSLLAGSLIAAGIAGRRRRSDRH